MSCDSSSVCRKSTASPSSAAVAAQAACTSSSVAVPYTSGSRDPSLERFGPLSTSTVRISDLLERAGEQLLGRVGQYARPGQAVEHDQPQVPAARLLVHGHGFAQFRPRAAQVL